MLSRWECLIPTSWPTREAGPVWYPETSRPLRVVAKSRLLYFLAAYSVPWARVAENSLGCFTRYSRAFR